jgi:tRNA U34 5-carboxymethylaminomethyl modifying GTPase MnmE/TrmE
MTPAAPAAVGILALQGCPEVFDRSTPPVGRVGFRRIRHDDGSLVDEVVVLAGGDHLLVMTHGGPGIRSAVSEALARRGCRLADPADPTWQALARAAHPAAVRALLCGADPGPCAARIPVVLITGPANAGKSSLLNAWCGRQRALVSDMPGTTRDLVAAETLVHGWRLHLLDSAGLRSTDDPLEAAGQALVATARQRADLVIYLDDPQQPAPGPQVGDLVVLGKADLRTAHPSERIGWSARDPDRWLDALGRAVLARLSLLPDDGPP